VDETFLQSHVVLNKNYGFFHTLAWLISRIFRIKLNNIRKRHVSYGVGLKKAESDFDFSVVEAGYMVFKLFKR
jgi:hypothetical protein